MGGALEASGVGIKASKRSLDKRFEEVDIGTALLTDLLTKEWSNLV